MSDDLEAKRAEQEAKRAANRAAFPGVTAIVDLWRASFGEGVIADGGQDFITGKTIGWISPPSPNCAACTGHAGERGCERMDYVAMDHDKPEPAKVFCGFRLAASPTIYYEKKGGR